MMLRFKTPVLVIVGLAICLTLMPPFARAHEGLHEQIVAITAKIRRDPANASLYLQRGELHRLHRDWRLAARDYDRAQRLQPGLSSVQLARGKMLFELGRFKQARMVLDQFLRRQPDQLDGLVTRGRVLVRLGVRAEAVKDFSHAIAVAQPPEPELFLERAQILSAEQKDINNALRGLDEGIARFGPLATLELAAIDLELRQKDFEAALTRLDLVMAQSDRKEAWLIQRGEILKAAGRNDEARKAFSAALLAIESLPPERRQHRATIQLQVRARAALKL